MIDRPLDTTIISQNWATDRAQAAYLQYLMILI